MSVTAWHIRTVRRLCHRPDRCPRENRFRIAPTAISVGCRYGPSHASDYQEALGDEPVLYSGMLFRDIAATEPPQTFLTLWATDFVAYHDVFVPTI